MTPLLQVVPMRPVLLLVLLVSCNADTDDPVPEPLRLDEPLAEDAVRAGEVTRASELFGGVSAEGRIGDFKLYNDRVQFIIQGVRDSSYYLPEGGGLIDADLVREGPGNDFVDEWQPLLGSNAVFEPLAITVDSDGSDGTAVVRVEGVDTPLALVEGALENPGMIPVAGLTVTTEYRLQPGAWWLEVVTTVEAPSAQSLSVGDLFIGAPEVAARFTEGFGRTEVASGYRWTGYTDEDGLGAAAILSGDGSPLGLGNLQLLTELTDLVVGFDQRDTGETTTLSWTRYWGVAPDLATLTDAAQQAWGSEAVALEGRTEPGARVAVFVDDAPFTLGRAGDDGTFSILAPEGATALAIGRATGRITDLPTDVSYGPYTEPETRQRTLEALGARTVNTVDGRGTGTPEDPLALGEAATVVVNVDDDLPFTVSLRPTDARPPLDERVTAERPGGNEAVGWSRGRTLTLPVPAGSYDVLVHRGSRHEIHTDALTVPPGGTATVSASLPAGYAHEGWLYGDPHQHASPSADGSISMEERLVVSAAAGIQIHFGTDHDHAADYRPLVGAMGIAHAIVSIVSDEVSAPSRGHMNIYPLDAVEEANGGAWRWWTEIPSSTEDLIDRLEARHDDFILQANHPTDDGIAMMSLWSEGEVGRADYWTERLGTIEVLNSGDTGDGLDFWVDLTLRGDGATPVGVSDAHHHLGSHQGFSGTFLQVGTDDPAALTHDALRAAFRDNRAVASRGPFLELSTLPGNTEAGASLTVTARTPSWYAVDRLLLMRDGTEVARIDGTTGTFALDADDDAVFWVIAEGDAPMAPVDSRPPWALAGPWRVDVDGDGWTPPLPPLQVGP